MLLSLRKKQAGRCIPGSFERNFDIFHREHSDTRYIESTSKSASSQIGIQVRVNKRLDPTRDSSAIFSRARRGEPFVFCNTCRQWKFAVEEQLGPLREARCRLGRTLGRMLQDEAGDIHLEEHRGVLDRNRHLGHRRHRDEAVLCDHHSKSPCDPEGGRGRLSDPATALGVSKKPAVADRLVVVDSRLLRLVKRSEDHASSLDRQKGEVHRSRKNGGRESKEE